MLVVDAHVHFHPCFRRDRFLEAAWNNLTRFAADPPAEDRVLPYLLLAEPPGTNCFARWRDQVGVPVGGWRMEETAEACSLLAVREDGASLVVVAGRQVPTAERLEVLALGTVSEIDAGIGLLDTLLAAAEHTRIVCIPWGFGKWWFRRGRAVRSAVERARPGELFLGDNAGRPRAGRPPRLFRLARERGLGILPGSDPFPLRRHEDRVGTIGFAVTAPIDPRRPMARLVEALSDGTEVRPRGERCDLLTFARDQVELRLGRSTAGSGEG